MFREFQDVSGKMKLCHNAGNFSAGNFAIPVKNAQKVTNTLSISANTKDI